MGVLDYLLLGLLFLWLSAVAVHMWKRKKTGGPGGCAGCSGCAGCGKCGRGNA